MHDSVTVVSVIAPDHLLRANFGSYCPSSETAPRGTGSGKSCHRLGRRPLSAVGIPEGCVRRITRRPRSCQSLACAAVGRGRSSQLSRFRGAVNTLTVVLFPTYSYVSLLSYHILLIAFSCGGGRVYESSCVGLKPRLSSLKRGSLCFANGV